MSADAVAHGRSRTGWLGRADVRIGVGIVAIVAWGFFFDALARSARWVLDTPLSILNPLHDLRIHYVDASVAQHHGDLYHFGANAFSNPPFAAYVFLPFHLIGWRATETLWTIGNLVVLAGVLTVVLHRWCRVRRVDAWFVAATLLAAGTVFFLYPLHSLLFWGQLDLVVFAAVFFDLFAVPRRARGVLVGVAAAIKLVPLVFVVWFVLRRDVPAAVRAVVAFVACTLAAALAWPHGSSEYWLHLLPDGKVLELAVDPTRIPISSATWIFGVGRLPNQSLRAMLGRPPFFWFGTFPWLPIALVLLAAGLVVVARLLVRHRVLGAFLTLTVLAELVSPVSWVHYWVFVALCPVLALVEWRRDRPLAIAALALMLSTCAALEDTHLLAASFTSMSPVVLFCVRNLYVLGGLGFLAVASWRSAVTATAEESLDPALAAALR